jgi:hypothetical protein
VSAGLEEGPEGAEASLDRAVWREVGWIFRDGGAIAVERHGDSIRLRPARITHLSDE